VAPGNNSQAIERVLSKRPWWESVGKSNIMVNLFISQFTRRGEFEKYSGKDKVVGSCAKCLNRMEGYKELTDKDLMFVNMFKFCEVG
jgi:7-cyano-7-deazaguanine synthase in queuosine biosynthesis